MTKQWMRKELDMKILEKLYKTKALRGVTLAKLFTPDNLQKTYERMNALKKNGTVAATTYYEILRPNKKGQPGCCKKKAAMYHLTSKGVIAVKKYRGEPYKDNEPGIKIKEEQLKPLYIGSLLIENIPLELINGRNFKREHALPNYVTIDLVYNDWRIIIEREQSATYRKALCQIVKGLLSAPYFGKVMVICQNEIQAALAARKWKEEHAPNVRFMSHTNIKGIELLLRDHSMSAIINAISAYNKNVEELPQPENGSTHIVNGEYCKIVDIIGYPPKTMRHLSSRLGQKVYVGVEKTSDLTIIAQKYPEILLPGYEFFTLNGLSCDSQVASMYGKKKQLYEN